ncbi:hypothetical protein [Ferrimonas pelagia]|uniref:Transmembrane protein n=1 Tax=Ferrimonas pelagia TaxID=1177826 RepID=A0ABP9ETF6_9GAMM
MTQLGTGTVLRQSPAQCCFHRLYQISLCLSSIPVLLLISWLFDSNTQLRETLLSLSLLLPAIAGLTVLWLTLFNANTEQIIEHALILDDAGITQLTYNEQRQLLWTDFAGYRIHPTLPRTVTLYHRHGQDLRFGYYMYSAEQRQCLFRHLQRRQLIA